MFVIDKDRFKEILEKEGISGWNRWWKEREEFMTPPVCGSIEELNEAIKCHIGVDLEGADLSGMVLDGVILSYADCRNADFTNSSLRHAELRCVEFTGSVLRGVDFTGANLTLSICNDTDMRGAIVDNARLLGTRLCGARLDGCDISKALECVPIEDFLEEMGIDPGDITVSEVTDDGVEKVVLEGVSGRRQKQDR